MNITTLLDTLDDLKNSKGVIPKKEFNKFFEILEAGDDGNCLFYSIEQLNSKYNFIELRHHLCQYYRSFDKDGNYPEDSIKAKLQMQMLADNEEDDGQLHEEVICNDNEWGGVMDVIALTDILKTSIVLFSMTNTGYTMQPYIYSDRAPTIFVKYNGKNHFEPLLPKFDLIERKSPTPTHLFKARSISSETKRQIALIEGNKKGSKKKSSSPLAKARSVSSETKRLIAQMDEQTKPKSNAKTKSKKMSHYDPDKEFQNWADIMMSKPNARGITKKSKGKHNKRKTRKHH